MNPIPLDQILQNLDLSNQDFIGYAIMLGIPILAGLAVIAFLSFRQKCAKRRSR